MTDLYGGYIILLLVLILFIGMSIGSFMNVVIHRLPLMIYGEAPENFSLTLPASHCPHCQRHICWYDNIPLLSWLLLHGKCRHCHAAISLRYPFTECLVGLYFLAVFLYHFLRPSDPLLSLTFFYHLLPDWILFCLVWCICWIDIQHYLIPDELSYGLLWSGLLFISVNLINLPSDQAIIGCAAIWIIMSLLQKSYFVIRKIDGLGSGDVKLFAAASVWLGWQKIPWLLLLSALLGVICMAGMLFYHHYRTKNPAVSQENMADIMPGRHFPFGPAIAIATLILFYI